jgi:hypothetical protein
MTPEEERAFREWQAIQAQNRTEAERWEESTRAAIEARRAALAERQAREAQETEELMHRIRVARMGGGVFLPDGTYTPYQPDPNTESGA